MCACDEGPQLCVKHADEEERDEQQAFWTAQDRRDYLNALCGISEPWHDLDSEGMCAL